MPHSMHTGFAAVKRTKPGSYLGSYAAIVYDFDGTLAKGNIQEASFLPELREEDRMEQARQIRCAQASILLVLSRAAGINLDQIGWQGNDRACTREFPAEGEA
jgi:hypothetical protein